MSARVLLDTNVLVCSYDRSEPEKQAQALAILERLHVNGSGCLSSQVLNEFFVAVTRRIAAPLTVEEAYGSVGNYLASWPVLAVTGLITLEGARGVLRYQMSFWDALIWATARLNQVPVVFSEDLPGELLLEGVRFVNPFAADFQLEEWAL